MSQTKTSNQAMKQLLKKFSSSELFVLSEAAAYLKVSEKYLTQLIREGKIKSFKVDDHWFIEEHWLLEYKKSLKQHLIRETTIHYQTNTRPQSWTRSITEPLRFKWSNLLVWLWQSVLLAVAVICLAFLLLPLYQINKQKQYVATLFLVGVDATYSWPLDTLAARPAQGAIDDELLTKKINDVISSYQRQGQVLGASELRSTPIIEPPSWWPK